MTSKAKTSVIPIIPLRSMVPFPANEMRFVVGREMSRAALDAADTTIALFPQLDSNIDTPQPADLFPIGAVSEIVEVTPLPDSNVRVRVMPLARVRLTAIPKKHPFLAGRTSPVTEIPGAGVTSEQIDRARALYLELVASPAEAFALRSQVSMLVESIRTFSPTKIPAATYRSLRAAAPELDLPAFLTQEDPGLLADSIAARSELPIAKQLELLEQLDKSQRLADLIRAIEQQLNNREFKRDLDERVREATKKEHREIYLREQLKQVLDELGDRSPLALFDPIFQGRSFKVDPTLVFVLMPFDDRFRPIYDEVIKPAVTSVGLRCLRADDLYGAKSIVEDIWRSINEARLIIADLSGKNPNVFYEIGLAHAIGKEVVFCSQSVDDIPFDLRHLRCVLYSDSVSGFRRLERGLAATLAGYPAPAAEA